MGCTIGESLCFHSPHCGLEPCLHKKSCLGLTCEPHGQMLLPTVGAQSATTGASTQMSPSLSCETCFHSAHSHPLETVVEEPRRGVAPTRMVALCEHGAHVFLGGIAILVARTAGASPSAARGPQPGLTWTCSVLRPCPQPLSFRSPFIYWEHRKATVPTGQHCIP